MDYKKLIENYFKGITTVEEEKALKKYFNSSEVNKELLPYKGLFVYWKKEQKHSISASIPKLLKRDNRLKINFLRKHYNLIRSVAAALSFLVLFGFVVHFYTKQNKPKDLEAYWAAKEMEDPQKAYQKARAALLLASKQLNHGRDAALDQIHKVQQASQFIKSPD